MSQDQFTRLLKFVVLLTRRVDTSGKTVRVNGPETREVPGFIAVLSLHHTKLPLSPQLMS